MTTSQLEIEVPDEALTLVLGDPQLTLTEPTNEIDLEGAEAVVTVFTEALTVESNEKPVELIYSDAGPPGPAGGKGEPGTPGAPGNGDVDMEDLTTLFENALY